MSVCALPRSRDDRLDEVGVVVNFARLIHPQTFGAWAFFRVVGVPS